ncbi:hypothetical protein [Ferrimonas marina]|uniref:Uncharacterized protein n=1 Tax=Ferrimonas marina TaxID=299255 RepID=A0A1M5TH82_9GAMM|nr:hypothetical protein [Ferrimonas marina]SHH50112.1 hypothetical protein SAMN02745129_2145 [Ferrimonas marina]
MQVNQLILAASLALPSPSQSPELTAVSEAVTDQLATDAAVTLLNSLTKSDPAYWAHRLNSHAQWREILVFRSTGSLDLTLSHWPEPNPRSRSLFLGDLEYVFESIDTSEHSEPVGSEARMVMGLPPIGQDGVPMRVCRLSDSSNAPYLEITEAEHVKLHQRHGVPFDPKLCLQGSFARDYWKDRIRQAVDVSGYISDAHN